jgi:hypothetical protein
MTSNHLLIYHLAELMLDHEQHILPVDLLFDDEQIGDYVKSIQIDSPYQQMLFEGVLTESVKDEKLLVSFTVEGYFHHVLGEVIYNRTEGLSADSLKQIVEENKLNGAKEGVEQCLIRDIHKDVLSRLILLIDKGGISLDVCSYPLAHAFLSNSIEKVLDYLLNEVTNNDIEILIRVLNGFNNLQKADLTKRLFENINSRILPDSLTKSILYVRSIKYIHENLRHDKLNYLLGFIDEDNVVEETGDLYLNIGEQFEYLAKYDKALYYYENSLRIKEVNYGKEHFKTAGCYCSL